ncbi:MAG: hypothetical protein CSA79_00635 [Thiothrix nivea]|nr:MAG: hypothetical protein CSA79_00635 [Thiothrix nivea]
MAVTGKNSQYPPFRLILLALILAGLLAALTIKLKKDDIALNLTQEVNKALVFAGLPLVDVSFEGRDGIISGVLGSESLPQQIVVAASRVNGVRIIDNRLQVNPVVESPPVNTDDIAIAEAEFEDGLYVPPKYHPLEKYNLSKVAFAYGHLSLTAESYPVLDKLAMILKRNPQITLELSVHTDNQGTALGQIAASQSRADNVKYYLVEQGVAAEQLVAKGYGASRPIASNETAEGQRQNRRVEIRVLKDS